MFLLQMLKNLITEKFYIMDLLKIQHKLGGITPIKIINENDWIKQKGYRKRIKLSALFLIINKIGNTWKDVYSQHCYTL